VSYQFDSPDTIHFDRDGIEFLGRRGEIVVDETAKTTRLVILDGWQMGHGGHTARQWTAGPVDATFHADRVVGRTSGQGRFVHLSRPPGLDRLPVLSIDGQNYAPGTHNDTLIVPIMPGQHQWEIQPLPQPPVFRTWQQW
jgi:hypothetical protein